ncbi:MAG: type II/IV secretion system ATPase subunit [Candidatus Anstonellaceae archaeon]
MQSLGWKTGNWKADYKLSVPHLSSEESQLVSDVSEAFRDAAQRKDVQSEEEARKLIERLLSSCCDQQGIELDADQSSYLLQAAYMQTFGLGFFQQLLSDNSLEEIAVIGLGLPVYIFVRGKGWLKTNVCIDSQDYFVSLVNRMGRNLGRRLTAQQPRINAVLEDGSRLHASMPPVSGCELTIRKFGAEPFSPFRLFSSKTFEAKSLALLSLAMQSDLSVIFTGNTASGKTSTLNAMLSFVPASERILLIEETPEISIPHPHQIRLLPFEESKIGMVELVRDSLRMRPDRVVIGEVRTAEEAQAFAESALSGQAKGCYATFHAQSARDALLRMRMMGCLESDLEGIDLVVVQRRVSTYDSRRRKIGEERKLTEIAVSSRSDALHPRTIFNGTSFSSPALSSLFGKISAGSGLSPSQISRELSLREKFLRGKKAGMPFTRAFDEIQKFCFGKGVL